MELYTLIEGCEPRQLRFGFALWTRKLVRDLIRQRFRVSLSIQHVGHDGPGRDLRRATVLATVKPPGPLKVFFERPLGLLSPYNFTRNDSTKALGRPSYVSTILETIWSADHIASGSRPTHSLGVAGTLRLIGSTILQSLFLTGLCQKNRGIAGMESLASCRTGLPQPPDA